MKQIKMNDTELVVSEICLGGGSFGSKLDEKQAFYALDRFYDAGGNFIDTARAYCGWIPGKAGFSEKVIGKWLKERQLSNKIVVATKGAHYDFMNPAISRVAEEAIRADLEESKKALGLDCIDFYWLHRDNEEVPIEELILIMEKLVKEGSIRYYGASNYTAERLKQAKKFAEVQNVKGFSAVQNQWSLAGKTKQAMEQEDSTLVTMDKEEFDWHIDTNIPLVPYSSTAGGFFAKLFGSANELRKESAKKHDLNLYWNSRNLMIYNDLFHLHKETGDSMISMSISYLLQQQFQVYPVCGLSSPEQLSEILKSCELKLPEKYVEKWNSMLSETDF